MKILHINSTYGRGGGGGTEQSIPNLCGLLEERGHQNVVIFSRALPNPSTVNGRMLVHLAGVCEGSRNVAQNRRLVDQVLQLAHSEQIEVVHFHQFNNALLAEELTKRFPSVYFVHNHVLTCPSGERLYKTNGQECHLNPGLACLVNPYLKKCGSRKPERVLHQYFNVFRLRKQASLFSELMVDSEFMKQSLIKSGFASEKISVTATVTELPELSEAELSYLLSAEPVVLYVGQLTEIKGIKFLLQAMALIKQPFRLVIVGDGYLAGELKILADKLNLTAKISFAGWVLKQDLAPYYKQAAVVVVPSIYPEPFGLVGTEAMAYARPVVAFRRGGIPEWLADGKTGFLAPPADVAALAEKIKELLNHPALAQQLGQNGRQYLIAKFNPLNHCNDILATYQRAIQSFEGKILKVEVKR
jgi:glycosyltransferase involved in cell wall biosynthesis